MKSENQLKAVIQSISLTIMLRQTIKEPSGVITEAAYIHCKMLDSADKQKWERAVQCAEVTSVNLSAHLP